MGRFVLATLVAVMLALTGYIAYSSTAGTAPDSPAVATDSASPCCTKSAASCCSDDATPACCKDKANCCQTKGEEGSCCQNPSKAEAIAGATKKTDDPKKVEDPK